MSTTSVYASRRMAQGYAFRRPAVHPQIVAAIAGDLPRGAEGASALDIGCGAGRSTVALAPVAARRVGLEPVHGMLEHSHRVDPDACFVVGRAERLPFASDRFHIVSAAGSLNYADLDRALPEAARVLRPDGVFVVYDFSAARRLRGDTRLDEWFSRFERRYPFPPGYAMDVRHADLAGAGLRLASYRPLEVAVPMTFTSYLEYAMSETNVEVAIAGGMPEEEIRGWCRAALEEVFEDGWRDVLFDAYAALLTKR
jgi:SAM-dependent methyltransferase